MTTTLDHAVVCGRCYTRIEAGQPVDVSETKTMGCQYKTVTLCPARATCDANRDAARAQARAAARAVLPQPVASTQPVRRPAPAPRTLPGLGRTPTNEDDGFYGDAEGRPLARGVTQEVYGGGDEG